MPLDADGFALPNEPGPAAMRVPPPMVNMPLFFDGCANGDDAIAKMINELGKPFSIELDGWDTMYRRLADALILILANQGGLSP